MSLGPYFRTPVPGPTEKRPLSVSSESKQFLASSQDSYATNKTFVELGVSPELCAVLTEQGIITAFPIQAMTIADALAGRDVCGKAKTGSGKTLGFGLPMFAAHLGRRVTPRQGRRSGATSGPRAATNA
jgi:superfamily II DNA/RNA helicase